MIDNPKMGRRGALGRLAQFGLAVVGMKLLGGCSVKPDYALEDPFLNPAHDRDDGAIRTRSYNVHKDTVIVRDPNTGRQYRVWVFHVKRPDTPHMDCEKEDFETRRRPTPFPGLFGPLLKGAHDATQSLKVGACDVYDYTVGPVTGAIRRFVDQSMIEANKYEVSKHVFGVHTVEGHVIRPAEFPDRIIVIEPYVLRGSSLQLQNPSRRNFLLGNRKPKGLG